MTDEVKILRDGLDKISGSGLATGISAKFARETLAKADSAVVEDKFKKDILYHGFHDRWDKVREIVRDELNKRTTP